MNCIRIVFSVFVLFHAHHGLAHNADSVKCWSATNKLTWSDFRGSVPKDMLKSIRRAVCPSQISVESISHNAAFQVRVKVIFLKNEAWTKDTASMYVLAHEQLHFDITELQARKIRKSVSELKEKEITDFTKYQVYIQKFVSENDKLQEEYDKQTNHGGFEDHQQVWREKISKELIALKMFATAANDCE